MATLNIHCKVCDRGLGGSCSDYHAGQIVAQTRWFIGHQLQVTIDGAICDRCAARISSQVVACAGEQPEPIEGGGS